MIPELQDNWMGNVCDLNPSCKQSYMHTLWKGFLLLHKTNHEEVMCGLHTQVSDHACDKSKNKLPQDIENYIG